VPRRSQCHNGWHLGIGAADPGIVAIGVGHGGFEIIADDELRHTGEKLEQVGMQADPVGQALAWAGLGVSVVRGPHRRYEQLHGPHFAGDGIEDVDVAGKIDEHLLPTNVGLTHAWARTLLPGLESRAKPGIAKAIEIGGASHNIKRVTLRGAVPSPHKADRGPVAGRFARLPSAPGTAAAPGPRRPCSPAAASSAPQDGLAAHNHAQRHYSPPTSAR
jgi:hypothetical protein